MVKEFKVGETYIFHHNDLPYSLDTCTEVNGGLFKIITRHFRGNYVDKTADSVSNGEMYSLAPKLINILYGVK